MTILVALLSILWCVRIIANILFYAQLWFVKEYRFDRMLVHLRTHQGRRIYFPPWRRPPLTPKTILLFLLTLGLLGSLYWSIQLPVVWRLLIIDSISYPVTWVIVGILQFPTIVYHRIQIARAVQTLRSHKPMTVVGITGSFGKTSVKDYLATILESTHKVLKTEASRNSPIGIAETILRDLRPDHELFIVEMGAYKRGEIASMASMVQPQIGIVTAINPQHQDLFGSMEATKRAKYELIEGLRGKQIAIFNFDNADTREVAGWADKSGKRIWWWSRRLQSVPFGEKLFYAKDIESGLDGVSFTCVLGGEQARIQTTVLGEHQVGNILAAIAGAVACGMSVAQAARAASGIMPAPKVMEKTSGVNGSTFINDTFNNNPDAALAAITFLGKYGGRKFLVFQPMIELGEYAISTHVAVGAYAARICDDIILTNANFSNAFLRGVRSVSSDVPFHIFSPPRAEAYLRSHIKNGDIVLFKGKEAEHALRRLLHNGIA